MLKKTPALSLVVLVLSACTGNSLENTTYELTNQDPENPSYLALKEDGTFTLDFNMCQGMNKGSGIYTIEGNAYFLDVEACTDCMPKDDLTVELPTVNIELEKISDTELKVKNKVLRVSEDGEKYGFCSINDEGNMFKLLESDTTTPDSAVVS